MLAESTRGGGDIFDDILSKLDENGDVPDEERHKDIVRLLAELGRRTEGISDIKDKVDDLENHSLIFLAKKYPKATIPIAIMAGIILIQTIAHLDLWMWIAELIRIPLP